MDSPYRSFTVIRPMLQGRPPGLNDMRFGMMRVVPAGQCESPGRDVIRPPMLPGGRGWR
jgi:hypothetical protein